MGIRSSAHLEPSLENTTIYACKYCKTHLATNKSIISKDYRGRTGRAFLVRNLININKGKLQEQEMTTGRYIIQYVSCHQCNRNIGWKYLKADAHSQLYKQGKYIMELKQVCKAI